MSDSDPDSSFEVVEEENILSFPDSSVETLGQDLTEDIQQSDIWNACPCELTTPCSQPETSEPSEQSWSELSNTLTMGRDSTLGETSLALRAPLKLEPAKLLHRRPRKRGKQLQLTENRKSVKPTSALSIHGKLVLTVIGLFGLTIALLYTTVRQAKIISLLRHEVAELQLQHEKELHDQFEKHTTQDATSRALILDLQKERHKLLNDLQNLLERQADRDTEAHETILELRTERRKLMDSVSSESPKRICKKLKTQNAVLEKQLKKTRDELDDVKEVLTELRKNSLCIPGMKFVNWILCKGLRLCPEHFH